MISPSAISPLNSRVVDEASNPYDANPYSSFGDLVPSSAGIASQIVMGKNASNSLPADSGLVLTSEQADTWSATLGASGDLNGDGVSFKPSWRAAETVRWGRFNDTQPLDFTQGGNFGYFTWDSNWNSLKSNNVEVFLVVSLNSADLKYIAIGQTGGGSAYNWIADNGSTNTSTTGDWSASNFKKDGVAQTPPTTRGQVWNITNGGTIADSTPVVLRYNANLSASSTSTSLFGYSNTWRLDGKLSFFGIVNNLAVGAPSAAQLNEIENWLLWNYGKI